MKPETASSPQGQPHQPGTWQFKSMKKTTLTDVFEKRQERVRVNVEEESQAILKTRSYKHRLQQILDAGSLARVDG
jgi:hypothetical protein